MKELRREGLTYGEIGRRLGISTATVSLYLGERRKRGILEVLRRRPAALRPLQESEEGSYLQNWTALVAL